MDWELIRNCDLPPPQKFLKHIGFPSPEKKNKVDWVEYDGENAGVLRALHLSQTRAREAEAKASVLTQRSKKMMGLLQKEALTLYSYKQMVRLLEIHIKWMEEEKQEKKKSIEMKEEGTEQQKKSKELEEEGVDHLKHSIGSSSSSSWCLALGFCLGVAGMGIVVGFRCYISSLVNGD